MKTPQFPTGDAANDREVMRRIYERDMREARKARNARGKALAWMIIISASTSAAAMTLGLLDLILQ